MNFCFRLSKLRLWLEVFTFISIKLYVVNWTDSKSLVVNSASVLIFFVP